MRRQTSRIMGTVAFLLATMALFTLTPLARAQQLSASSAPVGPSITGLSPNSGAIGASVTISGSGFGSSQGSSTVTFNRTTASVTTWSATSIVAVVPSGANTGNVIVEVSNKPSNGMTFTVVPAPNITSLSITTGAVGAAVTVTGTNFGWSTGTVKFNGIAATVSYWSPTSIAVTVPSGASTGNVVVFASGVNSNEVNFTVVVPAPSITSLSINSGPVGASVTITGTNFGSSQGSGAVSFNGTPAIVTRWGSTSISATVPPGATTGNIVVFASGMNSNGVNFTVAPSIPGSWTNVASMSVARANHTGTLLNDGRVLVVGPQATAEIFDPTSSTFIATGSMAGAGRDGGYTATLLQNGKVLLVGGWLGLTDLATAELWDPNTGLWTAAGSMSTARSSHTATLLSDGRVLIAGGFVANADGTTSVLATAEVYDPATATWSSTGSMNRARALHTATLLNSGKVLVAGGDSLSGTAELYDPMFSGWQSTGNLLEIRTAHRASLLNDGRVLITGGLGQLDDLTTSEIYDPAMEIWSATGSLGQKRTEGFTLVRLNDGRLLIAGGGLSEAELYDPSAGAWSATGSMSAERDYHSATVLVDGRVLVTGGWTEVCDPDPCFGCYSFILDSAEFYTP